MEQAHVRRNLVVFSASETLAEVQFLEEVGRAKFTLDPLSIRLTYLYFTLLKGETLAEYTGTQMRSMEIFASLGSTMPALGQS